MRKNKFLVMGMAATLVLSSMTLPENISLGGFSFGTLFAEASDEVASGTCGDNLTWVFDDEGTLTISGSGDMVSYMWFSLSSIDLDAIQSIIIEEGVTSIGSNAFVGFENLTSVDIADTVTSIGSGAFYNCTSLTSIEIPDSVTSISHGDLEISMYNGVFQGCTSLTDVKLPSGLTYIPQCMFAYCTSLTSLDFIPDTVERVCDSAFYGCSGLREFVLPESMTVIDDYAFWNTGFTSITIPSHITEIGYNAFWGCTNLTNLIISDGVEKIGYGAFYYCTSLTSVVIPSSVTSIAQAYGEGNNALGYYWSESSETIVDGFIIYGYSGTEAETYANDTGITFVDLDTLIAGDINHDGEVNYLDAMAALRYDAELMDLTDVQLSVGDVNDDGSVNSLDAIFILRYDAGLITSF